LSEVPVTDSVGAQLARAREERGLSLSDVAQQLKFAPRQLEALEQEHFEALPGGTVVRGMVRGYARLLKLEPEPLLERISGRFAAPDAGTLAARYSQPVPFSDNARRSTFVYLALSLGVLTISAAVAYSWYREHHQSAQLAKRAAPAPVKAAASAPRAQPKVVEVAATAELVKAEVSPKVTPPKPAVHTVSTIEKVATEKVEGAKVAKPLTGALNRLVIRCEEEV
jgi:cytoskeleton protein RodZ